MDFALKVVTGLKVLHIFIAYEIKKIIWKRLYTKSSRRRIFLEGRNGAVEASQLLSSSCLPLKIMIFPLTHC